MQVVENVKTVNSNSPETLDQKRTKCEIFSRVVGYIRPVHQWNPGKQSEFKDRAMLECGCE